MFRLMMLLAGLRGLLMSRPGKPEDALFVTPVGGGGRFFFSFFKRVPAWVKLRLDSIENSAPFPAFRFLLPVRKPGSF